MFSSALRRLIRTRVIVRISQFLPAMIANRTALLVAVLMLAASVGGIIGRPSARMSDERPAFSLESMIPRQFGDWREVPQSGFQVINPQMQELLDKLYSEIVTRIYVDSSGYRIMLSLAYGSDQRGSLQAHKPEVCYPAQGFTLIKNESGLVSTSFGDIPVRRLFAEKGARQEPVTYWFTLGDRGVEGRGYIYHHIVQLSYALTGRIPDGMLFRVSSIDADQERAHRIQEQFVRQLLSSVSPAERKRLSGLGSS